jgi:uncharacterized protein (TIGR02271 family)
MHTDQAIAWRGKTAVDSDGEKIGTVEEIYLDAETEQPEWLAVKTGLFGSKISFIPIADATDAGGDVRVAYSKTRVKDSPHAEPDGQLSQREEAQLYRHYGLDYGDSRSDTGLSDGSGGRTGTTVGDGDATPQGSAGVLGDDVSGRETDSAMTRSEEEVSVGTAQRESGRVRMRKYIVTDEVTQTVPVRREEVRVEREPITDANIGDATSGPELSEEEHEVTLHTEEVVAEKRVVPKERVRLDKDVETEQRQVTETARKEEVELVDADGQPAEGIDGERGTDAGIAR